MKYILLALLLSTVLALGQTANQWEIRKFTTNGMNSFWITGENSKAFGLNGSGVPAMLAVGGSSTLAGLSDVAISGLADLDFLQYNAGTSKWSNVPSSGFQPSNANLTSISALTTAAYGLSVLETANAAALRTLAGLGTAATATIATSVTNNAVPTIHSTAGSPDKAITGISSTGKIVFSSPTGTGSPVWNSAPTFTGSPKIGFGSSSFSSLQFYDSNGGGGDNFVAFRAPDSLASDTTFLLPSADGTSGQALITNGSGTLSFATVGVSDSDKGDITVSSSGTVWSIDSGAVSSADLRNSAAVSVIGRSANSTGVPADITAGSNDRVLMRTSNALSFAAIPLDSGSFFTGLLPVSKGGTGVSSTAGTTLFKALEIMPVDVAAVAQVVEITLSSPAGGTYFDISGVSALYATPVDYRVWINTGADSPPSAGGRTLVEVTGNANSDIVTAITPYFTASDSAGTLTITCLGAGACGAPDAGTIGATPTITTTGVDEVLILSPYLRDVLPETIVVAVSDETTALTTGAGKVKFRMPFAMTLTSVRASVGTAPTGSTISIGINEAGGNILSTDLTIDATEKTSTTAATAAVISDSALADDAEITIDLDQVGSTIAGAGLKVTLIGTR